MDTQSTPTHDDTVKQARGAAEIISQWELECEDRRSVHPESLDTLRRAGLFRVIQPRRLGGYELGLPTLHAVTMELGAACASTAWVYMVTAAHTFVMAMFPEETQDEIFAIDADTFIPGTLASQGKAIPVEGGFRLSGQWQFVSGCDHAKWGLFCAVQTDSTRADPKHVHAIVSSNDYRIEDTWHVMGLRGTGSKDVILDDVFVPAARAMPTGLLFDGMSPAAARHSTNVYRMPVLPALTYCLTAPVLALTHRIIDAHLKRTIKRRDRYDGSSKAANPTIQMRVAESWAELEAAEALVRDLGKMIDRTMKSGNHVDVVMGDEIKWRAAYSVKLCCRAADRLFESSGANTVYDRDPMQRLILSLHTAAHHAAVDFDNNAVAFGRSKLEQVSSVRGA